MWIAVTGGNGNLGRQVRKELEDHGHTVFSIGRGAALFRGQKHRRGDVLDPGFLVWALRDAEAIVHLAAIPNPFYEPPERIMAVNAQGTYNVLEAAARNQVRKVVLASSDSVFGYNFRTVAIPAQYLPVDEAHPCYAHDAYGLSKLVAEDLCEAFTRRTKVPTIALRICSIRYEESREQYAKDLELENPIPVLDGLLAYVDARDAARAFRLALETEGVEHARLYIAARDLFTKESTLSFLKRRHAQLAPLAEKLDTYQSVFDTSRASQVIGFKAEFSWRDYFNA